MKEEAYKKFMELFNACQTEVPFDSDWYDFDSSLYGLPDHDFVAEGYPAGSVLKCIEDESPNRNILILVLGPKENIYVAASDPLSSDFYGVPVTWWPLFGSVSLDYAHDVARIFGEQPGDNKTYYHTFLERANAHLAVAHKNMEPYNP